MNACFAKPGLAAVAALLLAAAPGSAPAQQDRGDGAVGAPVTLGPPGPEAGEERGTGPQPRAAPSGAETGAAEDGDAEEIRASALGEIDPNSVGLLDSESGGLGVAMWAGTGRAYVKRLLVRLPGAVRSPAVRDLARRLLLTAAQVPAAGPGRGRGGSPSLVAIRVERLVALGAVTDAAELLRVVPERLEDAAIARARVETALLLNDNAGACAEVGTGIRAYPDRFWRRAQVFCRLLAGETASAQIGAGLLEEQGVEDPAFFALVSRLAGNKGARVPVPEAADPLHIAMMRVANVQIPEEIVAAAGPAVLRTVALSPNASLDTRLEAAERAEALGALAADAVAELYTSVNFPPDEVANALTRAAELSGPRGRALLFHAARAQTVASAQAEILAEAFTLARGQGRYPTAVRVFLPVLAALEPSDDLGWFAPQAARALYLAGRPEAAAAWAALAARKPRASSRPEETAATSAAAEASQAESVPADVALWPLAAIAAVPAPEPAPAGAAPDAAADAEASESESATSGEETRPASDSAGEAAGSDAALGAGDDVEPGPVGGDVIESQPLGPGPAGAAAAAEGTGFDSEMFGRWWQARADAFGAPPRTEAARLLTLLDALGAAVPDTALRRTVSAERRPTGAPDAGLVAALARAAAAGRTGETILLSVLALGDDPPAAADGATLGHVTRALVALGLRREARALALEAVRDPGR